MTFKELNLTEPIQRSLTEAGYNLPTEIQSQSIPSILAGKDILGCAQTGTGKTAAFAIPIIQRLSTTAIRKGKRAIRALVLTPTRELAIQVSQSFEDYGKYTDLRQTVLFGGVSQGKQVTSLNSGVDILIATPGRLLDLMQQGYVNLTQVEVLVLDEADRMLDMGFVHDVKKVIAKVPVKRQTLFFSATMPVAIKKLANAILNNPVAVTVTPVSSTARKISQMVHFVNKREKTDLLVHLLEDEAIVRSLVFTRTKHGADKLVSQLSKTGIYAAAIHGNKSQNARQKALADFRDCRVRVLVATDIAARGIDIDDLQHVVNYELPNVPETYVHRIGRTGRAGLSGTAVSFCDVDEMSDLRSIQKLIGFNVPVGKAN